jgi:molybdenum cofactor cytidylyltransferase
MSSNRANSTAIILLAAGNSTRMGSPKQLLDFRGKPLLRHAVETALATGCGRVVVVLGAGAESLRSVLDGLDVDVVINPRWAEGMGTSIQTGLNALAGTDLRGAILALADQPFVTSQSLLRLITGHRATGKPIIASRYSGTVGVPVFFARAAFPSLLALEPNQGCKGVILEFGDQAQLVDCPEAAMDVDTPEDYSRAISR